MKKKLLLILIATLGATSVWAKLPHTIRCEGKAPFRRYNHDEIEGKVKYRMYDIDFNHSAMTYKAEYRFVVQTDCCGVPIQEFSDNTPTAGSFKIDEANPHKLISNDDMIKFSIDTKKKTCFFQIVDQDSTVNVKAKLVHAR